MFPLLYRQFKPNEIAVMYRSHYLSDSIEVRRFNLFYPLFGARKMFDSVVCIIELNSVADLKRAANQCHSDDTLNREIMHELCHKRKEKT
jgi:hypothetical protein